MSDICFLPATELVSLIRMRKLSARETMEAHLSQIERVNPRVNAIVTLVADQALKNADKGDEAQRRGEDLGSLHGLPVAHKDLFDTAGIRTTYGSRIYEDHVPSQDAIIVERAKHAGAISVGKTNTPEFGAGSQTFNEVFGTTKNPFDLTKTCGGSSGGSAVALACGMVPLADGSDHAASLRNPAAFCSVVGLRPAPGRVPSIHRPDAWFTLSVDGPMARNVGDLALYLSALAGSDSRSPLSITQQGSPFATDLGRDFRGARVAWFKDLGGAPFDRNVLESANAQRKIFEDLGCIVEEAEPDWTGADESYTTLRALGFLGAYAEHVRRHPDLVKDTIHWQVEQALKLTSEQIARAKAIHSELWHRWRVFTEKYEYFILPTTQVPPFDIRQPYITEIEGVKLSNYIDWMKSCYYLTVCEATAISVPCGYTHDGLPIGIQIAGRHRGEWSILQLARAFEQATIQNLRRPSL